MVVSVSVVLSVKFAEEEVSKVVVSTGVVGVVLSSLTLSVELISRVVEMVGDVSTDIVAPSVLLEDSVVTGVVELIILEVSYLVLVCGVVVVSSDIGVLVSEIDTEDEALVLSSIAEVVENVENSSDVGE